MQQLQALVDGLDFSHPPHVFQADLESLEEIQVLCEKAMAIHGSVDVLINNAGISSAAISWKLDPSEWNRVLSVNLTAPFLMSKELLPAMRKRGFWPHREHLIDRCADRCRGDGRICSLQGRAIWTVCIHGPRAGSKGNYCDIRSLWDI